MSEISIPWGGITLGDAGPYSADDWQGMYWALLLRDRTTQGYVRDYLNGLAPTAAGGAASPVTVETGAGINDGSFYHNSVAVEVVIPTPVGDTRIDRIVLRKSWAAQTIRITRIVGVEGGAAPAITQTDGVTWDVPICQAQITVGGVVTVTDERSIAIAGLAHKMLDEDNMASDDEDSVASQQSIKAYVDSQVAGVTQVATGTLTGDGAVSQAISGLGFQPVYVQITQRQTVDNTNVVRCMTTDTINDDIAAGGSIYETDTVLKFYDNQIISLDADGFTIDDAGADSFPNKNGELSNWVAIGA